MNPRKTLKSREERTHNVVSIEPFDNTSNAYRTEQPRKPETSFGFYLSIALITFLVISFIFIYELVVQTWQMLK